MLKLSEFMGFRLLTETALPNWKANFLERKNIFLFQTPYGDSTSKLELLHQLQDFPHYWSFRLLTETALPN